MKSKFAKFDSLQLSQFFNTVNYAVEHPRCWFCKCYLFHPPTCLAFSSDPKRYLVKPLA